MNPTNTAYLKSAFPKIYKENFEFEVEDGWFNIIRCMSFAIQTEIDISNENTNKENAISSELRSKISQVEVLQIKEKFGKIRVYYRGGNEMIHHFVFMAEYMSEITCECCGEPGKLIRSGWFKTLCPSCLSYRKIDHSKLRLVSTTNQPINDYTR